MKKSNLLLLLALVLYTSSVFAQDSLSIESAIDIALEKNLQVKVARNAAAIAHNNNHPGAAGMLPNVAINVGDNPSITSINQEFANGQSINRSGVNANAFTANLALSYTLFDGARMFAAKERLEKLDEAGQIKLQQQIQSTVASVIQSYHYLLTQEEYLRVLETSKELNRSRLVLVQVREKAGLANQSDLYLAELDLQLSVQAISTQKTTIRNARIDLARLLFLPEENIKIYRNPSFDYGLNKEELRQSLATNQELMLANYESEIALQTKKEIAAARLPKLGITAQYGYSLSKSEAGFSLYNQAYGPSAGITLSIPLFSGMVNERNYKNALLNYENAQLQKQNTEWNVQADFEQTWEIYSNLIQQVEADVKNKNIAFEYLQLMKQRFELGQTTVLELKEAQRSYEEVNYRLINDNYFLKLAEIDLKRLSNRLIAGNK